MSLKVEKCNYALDICEKNKRIKFHNRNIYAIWILWILLT